MRSNKQIKLVKLFSLISYVDLQGPATAEEVFRNIKERKYLREALDWPSFIDAENELLSDGHLRWSEQREDATELRESAHSTLQALIVGAPPAEITAAG